MNIHIGALLKEKIEEKGLIKDRVAEKLGVINNALHKTFKKQDVNTDILRKLSEIVQYNFFLAIGNSLETVKEDGNDNNYYLNKNYQPPTKEDQVYKEKYFKLLEKYTALLENKKTENTVISEKKQPEETDDFSNEAFIKKAEELNEIMKISVIMSNPFSTPEEKESAQKRLRTLNDKKRNDNTNK